MAHSTRRRWWLLGLAAAVAAPLLVTYVGRRPLSNADRGGRGQLLPLRYGATYVRDEGPRDGPVVLLVHGLAASSFVWDSLTPRLVAAGYRVIRYDQYGRGWSDRPSTRYSLDLYVEQLRGVLDALDLQGPVHLVGLSMGSLVAAAFTARYPSRVQHLGLMAPAGMGSQASRGASLLLAPGVGEWLMATFGHLFVRVGLSRAFHDRTALPAFQQRFAVQLRYRGYRRALLSTLRSLPLSNARSTYAVVGLHERPVLVLWGRQDRLTPVEDAGAVASLLPMAQLQILEDCGHTLPVERPGDVAARLQDFLGPAEAAAAR